MSTIASFPEPSAPRPAPARRMSYEEFLRREESNSLVEWVDGEVIVMSPLSKEAANVGFWLAKLISEYAATKQLGEVMTDPFQMKTGPDLPGRAPVIQFIATANLPRVKNLFTDGPADLVVEVISPGSRGTDRGDKFYEYERGGVSEYWLVDPERRQAEFYRRGADGIYKLTAPGSDGRYLSRELPGLWLRVDWLWQRPLPPTLGILKEWGII